MCDNADALSLDASNLIDSDGDGIGNNADIDDDGDGIADAHYELPLQAKWASMLTRKRKDCGKEES